MAALVDFARFAVDVTEVRDGDIGDHRTPNHAVFGLGRQAFTGQCTVCVLVADVALWDVMRAIAKVRTRPLHQFRIERVRHARHDVGHAGGDAVEPAGQVMLGLHRIRQQVVEAFAVVRRHLWAGVLQHHRSALLEQRQ